MNTSNESAQLGSDYDAEWGQEDASPNTSIDSQETSEAVTAPVDEAQVKQENVPQNTEGNPAAEQGADEDVWAAATPELLEAKRKLENDLKASKGRASASQREQARLQVEFEATLAENNRLTEAAREPTRFEQEHPEYAEDIAQLISQKLPQQAATNSDGDDVVVNQILQAHPDAGTFWGNSDFEGWLTTQPSYVQTAVVSSQAQEVIDVLSSYKVASNSASQENPNDTALENFASPQGNSSKPDLRTTGDLSPAERYNAEWDTDD